MKIVIADDHQVVIEGIKSVLQTRSNIEIVGTASNGKETLNIIDKLKGRVDIVIMDISMPKLDGIATTKRILKKYPCIDVLISTVHDDKTFIIDVVSSGASGYVTKNAGVGILVDALEAIYSGRNYFDEEKVSQVIKAWLKAGKPSAALTDRELDVLKLLAMDYNNDQIGDQLFISPHTVDTHRRNIHSKLEVKKVTALVRYAVKRGLI